MRKSELQQQARDYADAKMKEYDYPEVFGVMKVDVIELITQAYAQGWVDRDTLDMKPETQDEFFNGE